MFLCLGSGAFPAPGVLVLSVLEEGHKVCTQTALHEEHPLPLSLPSARLQMRRTSQLLPGFPSSPLPQLSICSSLANCGYLPEVENGITLAHWAGAVGGQCWPSRRGSPPHHSGTGELLPLQSAKEVRCGLQTIVAAHAFFITPAFCLENIIQPTCKVFRT